MKDPEIISAKNRLENLRNTSRESNHTEPSACQNTKLQGISIIKTIRSKKAAFLRKALSSKNPKEVWETVNRILDPPKNLIKHDPGDLDRYYTELASTLTNKENMAVDQLSIVISKHFTRIRKRQHLCYTTYDVY